MVRFSLDMLSSKKTYRWFLLCTTINRVSNSDGSLIHLWSSRLCESHWDMEWHSMGSVSLMGGRHALDICLCLQCVDRGEILIISQGSFTEGMWTFSVSSTGSMQLGTPIGVTLLFNDVYLHPNKQHLWTFFIYTYFLEPFYDKESMVVHRNGRMSYSMFKPLGAIVSSE